MGNTCCHFDESFEQKYQIETPFNSLNVVTLNYGGVLNNPFQFYSDDQIEENKLSEIFCALLPLYVKTFDSKNFDWDIGKIDLKLQAERYSPLYNLEAGIEKSKHRLLSAKDFQKLWDQHYQNGAKKIKIDPQPTSQQIQNMKFFDLICYHSILSYIYRIQSNRTLDKLKPQKLDPQKYQNFMKQKFSKSFLNENEKLQRVVNMLNQIDVAFIQQATDLLINKLKKDDRFLLREKGAGNSMIALRREKFLDKNKLIDVKKLSRLEDKKFLSFNGHQDVVYLCVDKLILISAHLSSKEEKNEPQVKAMRQFLNNLAKDFKGYKIILGADANSFVEPIGFSGQFSIFPAKSSVFTTRKKRTFLQPQFKKADKVVESCKDHIISTLHMLNQSVRTINEKNLKGQELLPTDQHPFDHFMVFCELQ